MPDDGMIAAIRESAVAISPTGGDSPPRIRAQRFTTPGWDAATWCRMGEMGWIGLRLPEQAGGSGLGRLEQGALLQELGRALIPEPLIEASLTAAILTAIGDETLLPGLVGGASFIPLAWQEAPDTLHAPGGAGPRRLHALPHAGGLALLPRVTAGAMALHAVPLDGMAPRPMQDGSFAAEWTSPTDPGPELPATAAIGPVIEAALQDAALATSFYLLGLAEQAFAMTLDYLRTREQFGRKLGSFQALQHRAADVRIALTLTLASVEAAAAGLDAGMSDSAAIRAVARAKTRAAETALLVTRQAVQLHGAIGYTDECDIGLYLRRAMVLANRYGSPRLHRQRFAAAG